jgi:uncharacterized protein
MDELDGTSRTALHWATHSQDTNSMETLLLCRADPDIGDKDGTNPLHIAACVGFRAGIELLLTAGANIERRDRIGNTPLYRAGIESQIDAIRLLLDAGADQCAPSFLNETPISYATYANQEEAIQLLRNGGCPLDNVDEWGYTYLLDVTFMDCHSLLPKFPIDEVSNTVRLPDEKKPVAYCGSQLHHLHHRNFAELKTKRRGSIRC